MKTKFGSIVVGGSGKLGGTSLQRNTGGYSMRSNSFRPKHPSSGSFTQRGFLHYASAAWRSYTAVQRAFFDNTSKSFTIKNSDGSVRVPTGFEFFIAQALFTLRAFGVLPTTFSLSTLKSNLTSITPTCVSSPFSLSVAFSPSPASAGFHFFYATKPFKPTVKVRESDYIYIGVRGSGQTSPTSFSSAYPYLVSPLAPVGYVIYIKYVFWFRSNPFALYTLYGSCVIS